MVIKPHYKIHYKNCPFNGWRWQDAIKFCLTVPNWQAGINTSTNGKRYHMWFWIDDNRKLRQITIPNALTDYVKELCKQKNYVA